MNRIKNARFSSGQHFFVGMCLCLLTLLPAAYGQYFQFSTDDYNQGNLLTLGKTFYSQDYESYKPLHQFSPTTSQPQFSAINVSSSFTSNANLASSSAHSFVKILADARTLNKLPSNTLLVSRLGNPFAMVFPRYRFGDILAKPTNKRDGTPVAPSFWQNSPLVVDDDRLPKTLDGSGNQVVVDRANFYYSSHARKPFAAKSGSVRLTWVASTPNGAGKYETLTEDFVVDAEPTLGVKQVFHNSPSMLGALPKVEVKDGRIKDIQFAYNDQIPEQIVSGSIVADANKTIWYDRSNQQIFAQHKTGRIFVEYLGDFIPDSDAQRYFLGADVLEVSAEMIAEEVPVEVGHRLNPRAANPSNPLVKKALDGSTSTEFVPDLSPLDGCYKQTMTNGSVRLHAEATTEAGPASKLKVMWSLRMDAAITINPVEGAPPQLYINWAAVYNSYTVTWPAENAYEIKAITDTSGMDNDTGFGVGTGTNQMPVIVFQDAANGTAKFDPETQRMNVELTNQYAHRTLLRFLNGDNIWYLRMHTQASDPDSLNLTATVGQRIEAPAAASYATAGYIESGLLYNANPGVYINPLATPNGVEAAAEGAIIPVNIDPDHTKNKLVVRWFTKIEDKVSGVFKSFYVPTRRATYTIAYPTATDANIIVLASNKGTATNNNAPRPLTPEQAAGTLYRQPDPTKPGYNPNEEHALLIDGVAYALRDDLNVTSGANYSSMPWVLLQYTDASGRPAMTAYKVERERGGHNFDLTGTQGIAPYWVTAGTQLLAPMPLPLLSPPLTTALDLRKIDEVSTTSTPSLASSSGDTTAFLGKFTFKDKGGYSWVYRGPHSDTNTTDKFSMRFYYQMQEGFDFSRDVVDLPVVGTTLPYLRTKNRDGTFVGDYKTGVSLEIFYRAQWPANAPSLQVGHTLTKPKNGLPDVYNQTSAVVAYQQSGVPASGIIANGVNSVDLVDLISQKSFAFPASSTAEKLLPKVRTNLYQGKKYFQDLPPDLQSRLYYSPRVGNYGGLVYEGKLVEDGSDTPYILPNYLSVADFDCLTISDPAKPTAAVFKDPNGAAWGLASVDYKFTFYAKDAAGVYRGTPQTTTDNTVGIKEVKSLPYDIPTAKSKTGVNRYALQPTGLGKGWVSMVFNNTDDPTNTNPVSMSVFKVTDRLARGALKSFPSPNPLDPSLSLRHTNERINPGEYDVEWAYKASDGSGTPPVYTYSYESMLGSTSWSYKYNSDEGFPPANNWESADLNLPNNLQQRKVDGLPKLTIPTLILKANSVPNLTTPLPFNYVFSSQLDPYTGFVLFISGVKAMAYNAPGEKNMEASSNLLPLVSQGSPRLSQQFRLDPALFKTGANEVVVYVYTTALNKYPAPLDFKLDKGVQTNLVTSPNGWQFITAAAAGNRGQIRLGSSANDPASSPLLLLSDNFFTFRYKLKGATVLPNLQTYSPWTEPVLVPSWIKRVLAGINPFNQRISDFTTNRVNSTVSMISQAGKRWEGDVALNLDNINDSGLIEIYETVLNKAKGLSIDQGVNYPAVNNALQLAAGYLSDLYTLLGNEALADADNPTIALDAASGTEVYTSRFSFEGQLASVMDEELALLRGRDDVSNSTPVDKGPVYNRLYWNFTGGINAGTAIYATNYAIAEDASAPTANGTLNAADAQRYYPQGHGDAYGHYLTALKGYYKLLRNPNFSWAKQTEVVEVLGTNVEVDYKDERKFAANAASLATTAAKIIDLSYRKSYKDDPASGWAHLYTTSDNASTSRTLAWGFDHWVSRATSGAYLHWVLANGLLPATDGVNTGIRKIDRTTVPELDLIATTAAGFQAAMDSANTRVNPLGVTQGSIPFDISATELKAGTATHYEQVYRRSLQAVLNAKGAFDQAGRMSRALRTQASTNTDLTQRIEDQERTFNYQLAEIYGQPYSGKIGTGKAWKQGYTGPDLQHWFIIDRPEVVPKSPGNPPATTTTGFFDLTKTHPVTFDIPKFSTVDPTFNNARVKNVKRIMTDFLGDNTTTYTFKQEELLQVSPGYGLVFADQQTDKPLGTRAQYGKLQDALLADYSAQVDVYATLLRMELVRKKYKLRLELAEENVTRTERLISNTNSTVGGIISLTAIRNTLNGLSYLTDATGKIQKDFAEAGTAAIPMSVGLAWDAFAPLRGGMKVGSGTLGAVSYTLSAGFKGAADQLSTGIDTLKLYSDQTNQRIDLDYQLKQSLYEMQLVAQELLEVNNTLEPKLLAVEKSKMVIGNRLAEANRIEAERTLFRQRSASMLQTNRFANLTYQVFRSEALEQYRTFFDLASRYTYLAAKSYDYETGLLGSPAGLAKINAIVAARALGDLSNNTPQLSSSTRGDAGLAGAMAQLQGDWIVAKGNLGINNPDQQGTYFSLRKGLFQLKYNMNGVATAARSTDGDSEWKQILQQHTKANILDDPDVANYCRGIHMTDARGDPLAAAVPGIVIPFSTTITAGRNFFGGPVELTSSFSPSANSVKIYSAGIALPGYVGMDVTAPNSLVQTNPEVNASSSLSPTPYVYLIPSGIDYLRAPGPVLGGPSIIRRWDVKDQILPLPFNLGGQKSDIYSSYSSLSREPGVGVLRKHPAFRAVDNRGYFYSTLQNDFTSSRLVGRSVWNSQWKIVIPGYTLRSNPQEGLRFFSNTVKDIEIFFKTYSSGN
jgi:hypothetical protein